jgi:hypothetical protein
VISSSNNASCILPLACMQKTITKISLETIYEQFQVTYELLYIQSKHCHIYQVTYEGLPSNMRGLPRNTV